MNASHTVPPVASTTGGRVATLAFAISLATPAGLVIVRLTVPPQGDVVAKHASSVNVSEGVSALVGSGSHVSWKDAAIAQSSGRVTWIVAPGKTIRVHSPAGEVEIGSGITTIKVREAIGSTKAHAIVAVQEGRAKVSPVGLPSVEVAANESVEVGPSGAKPVTSNGEDTFDDAKSEGGGDGAEGTNEELAEEVKSYKKKLEHLGAEKASLEQKLKSAEDRLAEREGKARRSPYDLTKGEWAELSKQGIVRYRMPCLRPEGTRLDDSDLAALGLAPHDRTAFVDAHRHSAERVWAVIRPLCQDALGPAAAGSVDTIGASSCMSIIQNVAAEGISMDETFQLYKAVGEMRAGLRPLPDPNAQVPPLVRLLLTLSGAAAEFEAELTTHFGPEDAHRLVYSDGYCVSQGSHQGGAVPRK